MNRVEELRIALLKQHEKKFAGIISKAVSEGDKSILRFLKEIVYSEKENGFIINEATKGYFRIARKNLSDCSPLFDILALNEHPVLEALLEVLGYDRMIPEKDEQIILMSRFYDFGKGLDRQYYSDPRYGLAAACAGWDPEVVKSFLEHCIATGDPALQYVARNSLHKKYVALR